jgi:hypothetical protein
MSYPVTYNVEYPEQLSRGMLILKVLFGWLYVGIPHGIILYFYGIAVFVALFISFFAILFTGKFPQSFFDFVVGYQRWTSNVTAYLYLWRDEYPPFSSQE